MSVDRDNVVAQAREFQEENEELLDDPMVDVTVLERIILQGAEIAVVFGQETEDRARAAEKAARKLEAAHRNRATSPKQLHKLTLTYNRLRGEYEAHHGPFLELTKFLERVRTAYYTVADVSTTELLEDLERADTEAEATEKAREETRPSWWRRLAGRMGSGRSGE